MKFKEISKNTTKKVSVTINIITLKSKSGNQIMEKTVGFDNIDDAIIFINERKLYFKNHNVDGEIILNTKKEINTSYKIIEENE